MIDQNRGEPRLGVDPEPAAGVRRALTRLVIGLAVGAALVVVVAPELFGDLRAVGEVVFLATVAGVPGLVLLLVIAAKRRRGG